MHHDVAAARSLADRYLTPLGDRWLHVQSAALHAEEVAAVAGPHDRDLLICAAWLHDIGYSPQARRTGFHPVDGAVLLRELCWPERLVALVAHHSEARILAAACGMAGPLAEFTREDGAVTDALVYADMSAGPDGGRPSLRRRLDDIELRHAGESAALRRARAARRQPLVAAVQRTERRLHGLHHVLRSA